jgi:hypothetical protein
LLEQAACDHEIASGRICPKGIGKRKELPLSANFHEKLAS